MTSTAPDYRKQKQIALTTLIGASLALGVVMAALRVETPNGITLLGSLALLLIGFRWLQLDSAELEIRRPMWLNVGIVMVAVVFVPYYLYKTRPAGRRGPAIASFFAILLASMFASALGSLMFCVSTGTTPARG